MKLYEILNLEHCTVEEIGNPAIGYRITSNEGWYIHLNNGNEEIANVWKGAVILLATYPFEQVQIVAEADLPENAEICGDVKPPSTL